jgi:hypothetical protein
MRGRRFLSFVALAAFVLGVAALSAADARTADSPDPLAAEIERWSTFLRNHAPGDESWGQIKGMAEPVLQRAQEALHDGQRLLALQRLSSVRMYLAASIYTEQKPAVKKDAAAFEAEWNRIGQTLRADLEPLRPGALDGVVPAAVRALAEASLAQVRVYYETSLEYGRNTMPQYGLLYLGVAQGQREFANFCRTLSDARGGSLPPARTLGPELDRLEGELLAAYRPPASIDKHGEFIATSSALKEARELDAAGFRFGALLRYLQTAQRLALLRAGSAPLDPVGLTRKLKDFETRLSKGGVDNSIGRIFLEAAQADLAHPAPRGSPAVAAAVAGDVLPRYFSALAPARPEPPPPDTQVTVTLVRWPYT